MVVVVVCAAGTCKRMWVLVGVIHCHLIFLAVIFRPMCVLSRVTQTHVVFLPVFVHYGSNIRSVYNVFIHERNTSSSMATINRSAAHVYCFSDAIKPVVFLHRRSVILDSEQVRMTADCAEDCGWIW